MKRLIILILGLTLAAASCNQQPTAIKVEPKVSGTSTEVPVLDPTPTTNIESRTETPKPTQVTKSFKVADLVVPKTEEEQDFQIDQNTLKNIEQDFRLDNLETVVPNPVPQPIPAPEPIPVPEPTPTPEPISIIPTPKPSIPPAPTVNCINGETFVCKNTFNKEISVKVTAHVKTLYISTLNVYKNGELFYSKQFVPSNASEFSIYKLDDFPSFTVDANSTTTLTSTGPTFYIDEPVITY